MALWADKHRPSTLDALTYHPALTAQLSLLTNSDHGLPHLLVYGPPGAGKRTRIIATLKALYGPGVDKIRMDTRTVVTPSNKKIEVPLLASNHHIEINPTDSGNQDRLIVQELIKEMAKTQNIDTSSKHRFKVVVISEAESLTLPAQHALRRTMEKYMANLRIILCCTSTSKLIPAIQSRCLLLRVPAPSVEEVARAVDDAAQLERVRFSPALLRLIAAGSQRNMRRALLAAESLYVAAGEKSHINENDVDVSTLKYDWETYIADTALMIIQEQSPERLLAVRARMYELLAHCIPASIIFSTLARNLATRVDEAMRGPIYKAAAHYEHYLCIGTKPIYHLEAFVARFMSIYKKYCFDLVL